jgi:hypothetical protein
MLFGTYVDTNVSDEPANAVFHPEDVDNRFLQNIRTKCRTTWHPIPRASVRTSGVIMMNLWTV